MTYNSAGLPHWLLDEVECGKHGLDADILVLTETHGAHTDKLRGNRWITCNEQLHKANCAAPDPDDKSKPAKDDYAGVAIHLSRRAASLVDDGQKGYVDGPAGSRIVWVRTAWSLSRRAGFRLLHPTLQM